MRRTIVQTLILGLSLTLLSGWSSAWASNAAVSKARQSLIRWEQTRSALKTAENKHQELAHRIAALKRVRQTDVANRTLQGLLQQSVRAADELERLTQLQSQTAAECEAVISAGIFRIDRKISTKKEGLNSPSKKVRKKTARRLRKLLQFRNELRAMQRQLQSSTQTPKSWKKYKVKIDPLDGPQELREKVEFLEDTRDKLRKKQKRLSILIKERRQMLALAKAANQFATDVSAFDESARSGRVERQGNQTGALSFQGSDGPTFAASDSEAPPQASQSPTRGGDSTNESAVANSSEGSAAAPEASSLSEPSSGSQATSKSIGTSIASPEQNSSTLVKQINPDLLINLKVSELGSEDLDVQQLNQLMNDLAKLDTYLKRQSTTILRRADQIEEDEKQVLQE